MTKKRRIKKSGLNSLQAENAAALGDYDKIRKPKPNKSFSAYINYFVVFATIIFVVVHFFDDGLEANSSLRLRVLKNYQFNNNRIPHHPIIIQLDNSFNRAERRHCLNHLKSRTISTWTKQDEAMQKRLWNDGLYEDPNGEWLSLPEYHDMKECKPIHTWATKSFPTCNNIHETSLHHSMVDNEHSRYLAHGAFRAVYKILDVDEPVAFKTFHGHKVLTKEFEDVLKDVEYLYTPFFYDKHRVDALIYERMSPSSRTMDIYGYCGFAGFFEFADGEVLEDIVIQDQEAEGKRPLTQRQKLSLAIEVAEAVADLHTIEGKNGYAAFMHGDLSLSQFVRVGGRFKLNDFNRGHIFYWNEEKQSTCPYPWDEGHRGTQRAPEEYFVQLLNEKVDVYTLGNIIYSIVFNIESYSDFGLQSKDIVKLIKKGKLPKFSSDFRNSDHAIDKAFYKAMMMCNRYKPEDRATASEVRDYLKKKYKKYYVKDRETDKDM